MRSQRKPLLLRIKTPPPKEQGKVFAFLNSPFVLFVLSSVLLSLITFFYKAYSEELAQKAKETTARRRITIELMERFENLSFYFTMMDDGTSKYASQFLTKGAFHEYEGRSITSLLYELAEVSDDTEEKFYLAGLIVSARNLQRGLNSFDSTQRSVILTREEKKSISSGFFHFYNQWIALRTNVKKRELGQRLFSADSIKRLEYIKRLQPIPVKADSMRPIEVDTTKQ